MNNHEKKEKSCSKKERKADAAVGSSDSLGFSQKKEIEETNSSCSIPPPLEHVKIYFNEKNFPAVEAEKFFNYFESNGWLVGGRAKMKDWKAAARNWIINIPKFTPRPKSSGNNPPTLNQSKNYGEPL